MIYAALLASVVVLSPLWVQIITPLRRRQYYSRFLWSDGRRVHLGTSYDLMWRMPRRDRRSVVREIRAGLAALPPGRYSACAWFLSPARMRRMDFIGEGASLWDKLDLAGGYLEILFQQWLITGRVRFFNPFHVRRVRFESFG